MVGEGANSKFRHGSKIAVRVRNINMALLILVLVLIIIVAVVIITDVTSKASKDLAFFYSLEAVDEFNSYMGRDLTLVQKVARSKAVTNWFADENNQNKRTAAYSEMMDYIGLFNSAELYFVIHESLNEFSIKGGSIEEFIPYDIIVREDPYNSWYFELISSGNDYAFNIDKDKATNEWRIWINHKVVFDGEIVGVFCSGLRVDVVLRSMFARYDKNNVKGFVVDRHGFIHLDSDFLEHDAQETARYLHTESLDPAFIDFMDSYLASIDGYFDRNTQTEVLKLSKGPYGYASIVPLANSDWSVITFYNSDSLFSIATLLPLVLMLTSVFLLYALASSAISRHFVLVPLNKLTASISKANENQTTIYGGDRDDEIGELARAIQEAWNRINEAHQRTQLMLDATPLACRLMKRVSYGQFVLFECNEESVKLFGFKDKHEFMERYFEIYPKYQPDGSRSIEKAGKYFENAYVEGRYTADFCFQTIDGTPVPAEVTLVRVKYGDDYVIAGYSRDMREHKQMMADIQKRDNLLNIINRVATVLLAAVTEENFENSLMESMELIGRCLEADCVQIWTNEMRGDILHFVLSHKWLSDIGREAPPVAIGTALRYTDRWEEIFLRGQCINGPISELPQEDQDLLSPLKLKSTITIPLFSREKFWGVFCVDDCVKERYFTEGEIGVLHSAALMLVNAINRNAQAAEIREVHNRTQLLSDAMPLAAHLWDRNIKLFDCNEESVRLFKMSSKQEYLDRFADLSPEYQPDGSRSHDMIPMYIRKAFEEGKCTAEWMHQSLDGIPIPSDVTLVRVAYEDDYAVAGYVRDLREYKRMMRDIHDSSVKLEAALQETRKANNAKSDFLASMSHEMRTPLNAIIGLSGLSLESSGLDEETSSNLEKVYSSGKMLLSIVNDILDISKIEAGRMELVEVDYDVPSLINDTVMQNILRIGEKPIKLKLDIGEDVFSRLHGDELRIKQIMNNLLSNAIKYTDKGTVELSVQCTRDNDRVWVTIKVSDTGKGIQPEDIGKLFMNYSQLDSLSNRKTEGTGLGLPITKSLAEMMSGSIGVESEYGKGSVFTVTITQKFISDVPIGQEVVKGLKGFRYSDDKRRQNARFKRISLPHARVLVVDDNLTNLEVAKGLMKPYGMQIDCVFDGQQAVNSIRDDKVRYDAVFMDHMMPGIDGIEATRIIREEIGTEYAKSIPIIALTANAIAGNKAMFLSHGFQAFVSKPIEIARLDEVIRHWIPDKNQESSFTAGEQIKQSDMDRRSLRIEINGLNIDKGIRGFGGDEDMYFHILRSFVTNTNPLLSSIVDINRIEIADYAVIVHGIKGSCRSICADGLADIAERLEKAAKAGDLEFISAHNPSFLQSARQLISAIDEMIAHVYPDNPKPKKEKPDVNLLDKLLDACKHFDTDEIDALIKALDSYDYESGGDFISGLVRSANQYNFREIKEKLLALGDCEGGIG